jgi:hypothetical protein
MPAVCSIELGTGAGLLLAFAGKIEQSLRRAPPPLHDGLPTCEVLVGLRLRGYLLFLASLPLETEAVFLALAANHRLASHRQHCLKPGTLLECDRAQCMPLLAPLAFGAEAVLLASR